MLKDTWEQPAQWGAGYAVALKFTARLERLVGLKAGEGGRGPVMESFVNMLRSLDLPQGLLKTLNSLMVSDLSFRKNFPAAWDLEGEFR